MTEEIRPVNIPRPRRVKALSREDREENEERFQKKLAELSGLSDKEPDADRDAEHQEQPPEEGHSGKAPPHMGTHLDVET